MGGHFLLMPDLTHRQPKIKLSHTAPVHGWLTLTVEINGRIEEIDASDVPNNPIEELLSALAQAASGCPSDVWWHLEPDGYFMYFTPCGDEVQFKLEFAVNSDASRGKVVLEAQGTPEQILLPFWRFIREFQTHCYNEPHWPVSDYRGIEALKAKIK